MGEREREGGVGTSVGRRVRGTDARAANKARARTGNTGVELASRVSKRTSGSPPDEAPVSVWSTGQRCTPSPPSPSPLPPKTQTTDKQLPCARGGPDVLVLGAVHEGEVVGTQDVLGRRVQRHQHHLRVANLRGRSRQSAGQQGGAKTCWRLLARARRGPLAPAGCTETGAEPSPISPPSGTTHPHDLAALLGVGHKQHELADQGVVGEAGVGEAAARASAERSVSNGATDRKQAHLADACTPCSALGMTGCAPDIIPPPTNHHSTHSQALPIPKGVGVHDHVHNASQDGRHTGGTGDQLPTPRLPASRPQGEHGRLGFRARAASRQACLRRNVPLPARFQVPTHTSWS